MSYSAWSHRQLDTNEQPNTHILLIKLWEEVKTELSMYKISTPIWDIGYHMSKDIW